MSKTGHATVAFTDRPLGAAHHSQGRYPRLRREGTTLETSPPSPNAPIWTTQLGTGVDPRRTAPSVAFGIGQRNGGGVMLCREQQSTNLIVLVFGVGVHAASRPTVSGELARPPRQKGPRRAPSVNLLSAGRLRRPIEDQPISVSIALISVGVIERGPPRKLRDVMVSLIVPVVPDAP